MKSQGLESVKPEATVWGTLHCRLRRRGTLHKLAIRAKKGVAEYKDLLK
jgi:hypothetical protein